jgi:arylsulfatase A-like enzyme/Flp pilus assembly protein TadD
MIRRWLRPFFFFLAALSAHISVAATKPNIILITLDSTRADRIGFLGGKAETTPNLDTLSGQSMIFEQAYAQSPLTVASHATILSGTYPQTHGVSEFGASLPATSPFIPRQLHAGGYHTAAFVGSIRLDPKNGYAPDFNRGFDSYDAGFHQPQRGQTRFTSVERQGSEVVARANAWLARAQSPFFLWVHLDDPHFPYGTSYDASVKAADKAVGKLIAALQIRKLYADALIVVAADHGESLGAHGEDTHGVFLYEETIRVPLLLKLPQNQSAGKRVHARAKLVDIAPTILEVAGVAIPSQMQGQSLLRIAKANPAADQPAYARSDFSQKAFGWSALESWRSGKYFYIRAPKPELYDLSSDPATTRNLAQSSKAILDTMASQLEAFDRRFTDEGKKAASGGLSSSEVQKLASLGYIGLQKSTTPASTAASGVDAKDTIATANKVLSAMESVNDGRPEKAVTILQPVVASNPKMYLAQYVLGTALAGQQRYPEAIEHLRQAIELQADSAWAHLQMGAALSKTGDYKTAAIHLEIATNRLPELALAHSLLGEAYEHLGRNDDAKRERALSAK